MSADTLRLIVGLTLATAAALGVATLIRGTWWRNLAGVAALVLTAMVVVVAVREVIA
ncbi:hypothetical protein [Micromonospora sp. NBC_01813]|uniref:hypothetical protein n=1 Tax=Micromonospora sp. NBC_01813 TaxID=2975988 RepID=UPI002DDAAA49|nr:hypothetical protein [Micromonospora sp. NBC_01813]WSA11580.1 hypothetical protein OG958_12795 [Micromonospora sp. NBC_01813]